MSSQSEPGTTLQERSSQATSVLCQALELGELSSANQKYLALALMQVATEEVSRNGSFAERVRSLYLSLVPQKTTGTKPTASASWQIKLTPVGTVDQSLLDPYGPPNPFALQQLYGDAQLPLALERYSPARLKEAAEIVQQRFPGTKPKKNSKASIIEYIVSTITAGSTADGSER